jgi:nucleotide-binding universal stress UspA family protein
VIALHINENQSDDTKETDEHDRLCAWIPPEFRSECSIKEWVRQGDAAEQIIHAATSEGCDLVVLGAQHKKFRETTVLGTTTLKVTRHSSCPVLVITQR